MRPVDEQLEILMSGGVEVLPEDGLRQKLEAAAREKRPLRVKQGFDPTSPDLHLGHAVGLRKLRQFQDLGHQVVAIVGDFTASIGDPSGRSATRPQLGEEDIKRNAQTYFDQLGRILDTTRLEVRHNSEWLGELAAADMIKLAARVTVARLLERDDFHKRFTQNQPIALHELYYPLMQAYDSVMIKADIELGGTDQRFNNLMGRDLQEAYGQPPQVVMVLPLLEGLDGVQKMSKSLNNYVGITDEPRDMFGKVMSVDDALMIKFWRLAADLPEREVAHIVGQIEGGTLHPMEAKMALASRIVSMYHSKEAAADAHRHFTEVHRKKETPDQMEEFGLRPEEQVPLQKLLVDAGLAPSGAEAKRLIKQGGVKLDDQVIGDPNAAVCLDGKPRVLQVGKRRFLRLVPG